MELNECRELASRLYQRLARVVRGRDDVIELLIISLFADGHVLLEDFPGSGKTTLAKTLGEAIIDGRPPAERGHLEPFRRIQFTPDLLPSDVTGTTVFEPKNGSFVFRPGPVFAHVVLVDEINRTSPKVQAAMLEAMGEKQVTIDNETHQLDDLFFVVATQNPLDLAGTFPLPVAQLDRFLFKLRMQHIDRNSELEVLRTRKDRRDHADRTLPGVERLQILEARRTIEEQVAFHPLLEEALVDAAMNVRDDRRVLQGVSTRSLVLAVPAMKTRAVLHNRNYVSSEDIAVLLPRIFGHRLELSAGSSEADVVVQDALRPVLERVERAALADAG